MRGLPTSVLMENAGRAVAEAVRHIFRAVDSKRILLLIGPGNNGGDGLVAARYLHDWGAVVSVYLCAERKADANLEMVRKRDIAVIEGWRDENGAQLQKALAPADAVIDALLGTGKVRPLTGIYQEALGQVAEAKKARPALKVVAVDLPSGLNADTGAADPATPFADYTITLGLPKPGLFSFPGAERVGTLTIVDIGIPSDLTQSIATELMSDEWARSVLPPRPLNANKGTFGKVLVVSGSINYIGAAYLACSGAMRVGAGLVTLATSVTLQPVLAAKLTESTYLPLPESAPGIISPQAVDIIRDQFSNYDALLVGCGLGQSQSASELIRSLLSQSGLPHLILDADALNLVATTPSWWKLADDAVITPHPGEMSRLAQVPIAEIQSDRMNVARKFAAKWRKTIVLKGAYTVVAAPDGRVSVSPFANPGLASAGTGDVLAGAIAGLLAQGLQLYDAACLGVYLHGRAGEIVRDSLGDTGMVAGDLLTVLPKAIKQVKETAG